jgi:hypothetical protein
MTRIAVVERTLPLDLPDPMAHPTGSVFDLRRPFTLPLNQAISKSKVAGSYTELDRKLWATLVSLAWDNLKTQVVHEADARAINALFREASGRTGNDTAKRILASARSLSRLSIELEDDEEEGVTTMLAGLTIKKISGRIYYQFSDLLLRYLLKNEKFSRLRLHFMLGLSGKYSVSLYMLLEGAANLRHPVLEYSIEELRSYLCVPQGKLLRWVDLYRFAVEPTIKQINDDPSASGFSVECKAIKASRKFERIRFVITKAEGRQLAEAGMTKEKPRETPRTPAEKSYSVDDALAIIRKFAPGLDAQWLLQEFENSAANGTLRNPLGALTNFARKKHTEEKRGGSLF